MQANFRIANQILKSALPTGKISTIFSAEKQRAQLSESWPYTNLSTYMHRMFVFADYCRLCLKLQHAYRHQLCLKLNMFEAESSMNTYTEKKASRHLPLNFINNTKGSFRIKCKKKFASNVKKNLPPFSSVNIGLLLFLFYYLSRKCCDINKFWNFIICEKYELK